MENYKVQLNLDENHTSMNLHAAILSTKERSFFIIKKSAISFSVFQENIAIHLWRHCLRSEQLLTFNDGEDELSCVNRHESKSRPVLLGWEISNHHYSWMGLLRLAYRGHLPLKKTCEARWWNKLVDSTQALSQAPVRTSPIWGSGLHSTQKAHIN